MEESQKKAVLESLKQTGERQIMVGGWSMWPFIRNGDTILIRQVTGGLKLGDVAVFFLENQLIAHRIVWKSSQNKAGRLLWLQGDFSSLKPYWVKADEIIGVVAKKSKKGQFSSLWLTFPSSILAIFLSILFRLIWLPFRAVKNMQRP